MMERKIERREDFAPGDPGLAAVRADLKSGRFRTLDDRIKFSGALMACDLDFIDSNRIPIQALSAIQDLDHKAESAND